MLRCVAVVTTVVSEQRIASIIRVSYVSPKRRFLQESHGVTSQKTAFFTTIPVLKTDAEQQGSICFNVRVTLKTAHPIIYTLAWKKSYCNKNRINLCLEI
jgi:hypothetical protein